LLRLLEPTVFGTPVHHWSDRQRFRGVPEGRFGEDFCTVAEQEVTGMASKPKTMWVIFAPPQQSGPRANLYIALDGTRTESKQEGAKFYSNTRALEFAKEKNIELDGAMRYVAQDDFNEFEMQEGVVMID
jgi:hypothetical protein